MVSLIQTDYVAITNDLFRKFHIAPVRNLSECEPSSFVTLYEGILGDRIKGTNIQTTYIVHEYKFTYIPLKHVLNFIHTLLTNSYFLRETLSNQGTALLPLLQRIIYINLTVVPHMAVSPLEAEA